MAVVDETAQLTIGLLHPGEMGAAVGHCLATAGHTVLWASAGRSQDTATRADDAGLIDAGTIEAVISQAAVIFSICPPHAARGVAASVRGFTGRYVDANAIAPATASAVAEIITDGGGRYVDGGIIGPPPLAPGSTRLYLSGQEADLTSQLFAGTALDARAVGAGPFSASSVKMAYAAWTKGSAALLLTARALAEAEGVGAALLAEWALSGPGLAGRLAGAEQSAVKKGWRWVAEMEEIAATMTAAGLPAGFHEAAAEVYRRHPRPESGADPAS
jgi:3-hydroxyisobutyrate dehydrogenase-like beta-hydroxyacid dehydrogenase